MPGSTQRLTIERASASHSSASGRSCAKPTSAALAKNGFGDIATFETLVRFYATREEHVVTDTESSKRNYRNADSNKRKRGCDGDAGEAAASGAADGLHESRTMLLARPIAETRGHTGYLTVARKMC